MLFDRLKKSTDKEEAEFQRQLSEQELTFKEKLTIVFSAYVALVLPCILILLVLSVLVCFLFGIF